MNGLLVSAAGDGPAVGQLASRLHDAPASAAVTRRDGHDKLAHHIGRPSKHLFTEGGRLLEQ